MKCLVLILLIFLSSGEAKPPVIAKNCPQIFSTMNNLKGTTLDLHRPENYRLSRQLISIAENILEEQDIKVRGAIDVLKDGAVFFQRYSGARNNNVDIAFTKDGILLGYKLSKKNKHEYQCSQQLTRIFSK